MNTLVGYSTFAFLYWLLKDLVNYLIIAAAAHFVSVAVTFTLYRRFVFPVHDSVWLAFLRYNVALIGSLLLGLILMALFVQLGGLNPLLAQALTIVITTGGNYVIHRFFTFPVQGPR